VFVDGRDSPIRLPFSPGSEIERREVLHDATWLTMPVTVIDDDGDVLAVRIDPGTPMTFPAHPFGPHPWGGQSAWQGSTVLQLHRTGDWYAVWRLFDGGRDLGWYINFEEPVRRGPTWFATADHGLDIVIAVDGSWQWKDVEDVDELVRIGRLTQAAADAVRARAAEVAADLDAGRRWWADWDSWSPSTPTR
jgi:uncharacterized protein DUF402